MKALIKTNNLVLIRIKIFTFRDVWLFLIGILFVSTTSGAIGSFMLGVTNEEFLIGEAENILIVAQPGTTTPLTGSVPEYFQDDIQKVKGVIAISPETLTFSVAQNLNDKAILVRGITPNYTQVTPVTVLDGSWFDPTYGISDEIQVNGGMIGYLLAEGLGVSVGDKLYLASTLTDMVLEIVITGIIRSNTPSDEEILVPLSIGKSLIGRDPSFVSFLRVLIDEKKITKEILSGIINEEYTVPIVLRSIDPILLSTSGKIPIVVYTPLGAHVETIHAGIDNRTEFNLRFGTYEFLASPIDRQASQPLKIFVNQSFIKSFDIMVGELVYDVNFNITYNNQPAINAFVSIQEQFGKRRINSSYTKENGITTFHNLTSNFYQVTVQYGSLSNTSVIKITNSTTIDIFLENSLTLNIINVSSNQEVHGGTVTIFNQSDLTEISNINDYQSGSPIFLNPDFYQVKFQYNGIIREFTSYLKEKVQKALFIGNSTLKVVIYGENKTKLESANISILLSNDTITQALTNLSGVYEFQLEAGLKYNITVVSPIDQSRFQSVEITLGNSSIVYFDFLDVYRLDIIVINGSIENQENNTILGCNVTVMKDFIQFYQEISNSTGHVTFNLSTSGKYQINAEKSGYRWNNTVDIRYPNSSLLIRLGDVGLQVSTKSISGRPIPNVEIILTNKTGFMYSGVTNSSGSLDQIVPIGDYLYEVVFNYQLYSAENISFSESQYIFIEQIIELSGNITISLTNQFDQKVSKAFISLTNEYYNLEYKGFTDEEGHITYFNVPWGNWSVHITFIDEVFPHYLIELTKFTDHFSIVVESSKPILDVSKYSWENQKSFSVILSADYVSGFLETTLNIILTTFTSLVIIISVLSLLSIASVISQPIVSNGKTLGTFQQLGGSRWQISSGVVTHLSILGLIASIFGAFIGMWVLTIIPELKNVNIGGMIIRPKIDLWIMVLISLSNLSVIILKAAQKVHQLYSEGFM